MGCISIKWRLETNRFLVGINLDNSEQRINRFIYKPMKNLFFKNSKVASHNYATDNKWSLFKGVSPEDLVKNFNNIFLLYWECTPHKYNQNVPIILVSINDDKTANFSYINGDPDDLASVKGCSCWYTVDHDGFAHVKEFNEILDMKNVVHVNAIAATIIRDIFGDFDIPKASQKFINNLLEESKKRKEN